MKEIVRCAMLGNKQAQEECTQNYGPIPCPCCGGFAGVCFDLSAPEETPYYCGCFDCGLEIYGKTEKEAVAKWNTRKSPPFGRCKDCSYFKPWCECGDTGNNVQPDDYCNYFVPKGKPE